MGTVHTALPAQTLYVTIRRDELRQLKDERDQLKQELAQLRLLLQAGQMQPLAVTQRAPLA
jgi:ribosomal protein L29